MLRIGLIKADYVNPDFIPRFGDLPDMFGRFFGRAGPLQLDTFDATQDRLPAGGYSCDAFVITGSRNCALDELPWIGRLKRFIADRARAGDKLIGFCFGHQVLAAALDGRVERAPGEWNVGVRPVRIARRAGWMLPAVPALNLLFNHRDQVVRAPPGAEILAGDPRCPVQMFEWGGRVLGLQAHPEYAIDYQEALMGVASVLPAEVRADASLRNRTVPADNDVALAWLMRFIRG